MTVTVGVAVTTAGVDGDRISIASVLNRVLVEPVTEDDADLLPVVAVAEHEDDWVDKTVKKSDTHDDKFHDIWHGFLSVAEIANSRHPNVGTKIRKPTN